MLTNYIFSPISFEDKTSVTQMLVFKTQLSMTSSTKALGDDSSSSGLQPLIRLFFSPKLSNMRVPILNFNNEKQTDW